jgi:3-methyladenine DNA glycosylase/8-oxoguanine DNA glycosylase
MAERARFSVKPTRPYSLERTAARFLRFPELVDHFQDGVYRRLFQVGRRLLLLSVRQLGPPSQALLEVRLAGKDAGASEARAAATRLLERSLGIHADIPAFYRACRNDPLLAEAIRRARGLSVAGFPDPWEALVTAVVSQQVNLALAYRIRRDLALRFGRRARIAGKTHIAFPRPERMAKETVARLRRLGLSRAKAETLLRLANGFRRGVPISLFRGRSGWQRRRRLACAGSGFPGPRRRRCCGSQMDSGGACWRRPSWPRSPTRS